MIAAEWELGLSKHSQVYLRYKLVCEYFLFQVFALNIASGKNKSTQESLKVEGGV